MQTKVKSHPRSVKGKGNTTVKTHTRNKVSDFKKKDGSLKRTTYSEAQKGNPVAHRVIAIDLGKTLAKHKKMVGTSGNSMKGMRINPSAQLSSINHHRKAAGLPAHTMGNYTAIKRFKK